MVNTKQYEEAQVSQDINIELAICDSSVTMWSESNGKSWHLSWASDTPITSEEIGDAVANMHRSWVAAMSTHQYIPRGLKK